MKEEKETATAPNTPPISRAERTRRLRAQEQKIDRGIKQFWIVGQALAKIREEELYTISHETFEDYCKERWEFTAGRARQLIAAAEVALSLEAQTRGLIMNERQARELLVLTPEDRQQVLERTAGQGREATAAKLAEVRRKLLDALPKTEKAAQLAANEAKTLGGDGLAVRLRRIERLHRKLTEEVRAIGSESERGVELLTQFLEWLRTDIAPAAA